MYHVVMGVSLDDEQLEEKVEVVIELPRPTDSIRVSLVHVHEGDRSVETVPAVEEALELLAETGIETDVYGPVGSDIPEGVIEAAEELDANMLCIGGRRRSPAGKRQLKNGAQEIIIRASCPVLVAGEFESDKPRV